MASCNYNYHDNFGYDDYKNTRWIVSWELSWAGFKASGHDLMRNGWQATEMRNHNTFASQLILENKDQNVVLQSEIFDDHYRMQGRRYEDLQASGGRLRFGLRHCARDINVQLHGPMPTFIPVDLDVREIDYTFFRVRDHLFPRLIKEPEQRIIVPKDPTVDELLAQIIAKQQPGQVEYFNQKVKNREVPDAVMMGQIIQLRA
jgi:hypothetical protein